jgi:putative DNA methylase
MPYKRKLIEVALPLDAINKESAREKSIRHGHPSTLHLWWARRPLATCRAVLFASLVDDPSAHPDKFPTEADQAVERQRLFVIIEELVKWENSTNEKVLDAARAEIMASCDGNPPPVLDPFCGGGSIPLEAQRLGLEAYASDLNPVAVLITKALIEIPPLFADQPPVRPGSEKQDQLTTWKGAQGLAEDVRYYGRWMRDQAEKRIGHLYPKVKLPKDQGGGEATVIAWIWARTVTCSNPACGAQTPLASSYVLSSKKGKERWIVPTVKSKTVTFGIGGPEGKAPKPPKLGRGAKFVCVICDAAMTDAHIKAEGMAGRLGAVLMATVAEGNRQRVYLPPSATHVSAAQVDRPTNGPVGDLADDPRNIWCKQYGLTALTDLFTNRQLVALTTFSDLVTEVRTKIEADARTAGRSEDTGPLRDAGAGARAYAEAVSVYLSLVVSRLTDYMSSLTTWASNPQMEILRNTFARQALPMTWDFAEGNPFASSSGSLTIMLDRVSRAIRCANTIDSKVAQGDATRSIRPPALLSTDPPYYDNIGYADLSDFFYTWLRRSLASVYPDELSTLLVPKLEELVATPYRFGGDKTKAESFFESGLADAFKLMHKAQDDRFPMTVYYAFKQAESADEGIASTGWDTMLQSLIDAGFLIDGTWPVRSERAGRMLSIGTNALASSIVLVCRKRLSSAIVATRTEFVPELKAELPGALRHLQEGSIAPVDLAQAAIGPGMAVFSKYAKVLEADGSPMRVRTALQLINEVLDETLEGLDADFDTDTRWAVTWFEEHGMDEGAFGAAEQLSKSRNTSVDGLAEAGIIGRRPGKVWLLDRGDLDAGWDPASDRRATVWEAAQHLIRRLDEGGEEAAAKLLRTLPGTMADNAKELAYRLYVTCERKKWAHEALGYNALVIAWPELTRLAGTAAYTTASLFGES